MTSGYRMDLDYQAIGGNKLQGWELGHYVYLLIFFNVTVLRSYILY